MGLKLEVTIPPVFRILLDADALSVYERVFSALMKVPDLPTAELPHINYLNTTFSSLSLFWALSMLFVSSNLTLPRKSLIYIPPQLSYVSHTYFPHMKNVTHMTYVTHVTQVRLVTHALERLWLVRSRGSGSRATGRMASDRGFTQLRQAMHFFITNLLYYLQVTATFHFDTHKQAALSRVYTCDLNS